MPYAVGVTADETIVLYDGVCGLCHRAVRFLLAHDAGGGLRFAPLQGDTAATLRRRHPAIPTGLESVVLVSGGRVHLRGAAFLEVARHLDRPWRWLHHLRWLPAAVVDPIYRLVARLRYRLFGRLDACAPPSAAHRERLLP
jgi:predicted DCC family thiol-disulfide oxidoreductase YuxK